MCVKLQLVIGYDEGQEETGTDVIALNKNQQRIEHRGLTLAESKQLLSTIQRTSFLPAGRGPGKIQRQRRNRARSKLHRCTALT